MSCIITLDCGTTNTRAILWKNGVAAASFRSEAGVRDTARTGSPDFLAQAVAACLQRVAAQAGVAPEAVRAVLASGMITSNLGLKEIPHLIAPAGLKELASGMTRTVLPDVWPGPMWFIAGVRPNQGKVAAKDIAATDMMRGEETEAMALLDLVRPALPCLIALPGSHSKYIPVDANGRITGSLSTLTGEMFQAIATQTILASSVDMESRETDAEWLIRGFETARDLGVGRALYCTRLAQLWCDSSAAQRTSYLLGAIMQSDAHLLRASSALSPTTSILLTGRGELKKALAVLLRHDRFFTTVTEAPEDLKNLAAHGAILVARERGIL